MFSVPSYDGILLSLGTITKENQERMRELGVHGFLRVPDEFPVIGDCGAFSYLKQPVPP
jgi:hypothetical protein